MTKMTYQTPALRAHGSVEALTKSTQVGTAIDAAFPANTLISDLTVS